MDRLSAMRAAAVVDELGGFSAAAERLGLSGPAATRAVAALEAQLGVRLFNRTTRRVSSTDAGRRYLAEARRILSDIDAVEAEARGAQTAPVGRLTVTAPTVFGRLYVLPLITQFLAEHPQTSVEAQFVDRVVDLVAENIDVAVRIGPLPDSTLMARRIGSVRRVICAAPSYLKRKGTPLSAADLGDHEIIAARSAAAVAPLGPATPAPRLIVSDVAAAIAAAEAGGGIVSVLSYQVADQLRDGRLARLFEQEDEDARPVHLVHSAGRRPSAAIRVFLASAERTLPQIAGFEP